MAAVRVSFWENGLRQSVIVSVSSNPVGMRSRLSGRPVWICRICNKKSTLRNAFCSTQSASRSTARWNQREKNHDPPPIPRRAASTARWNVHESDTTRRLYHAEPLVRHVEMYTKVTRPAVCTTQSHYYRTFKYTRKWHDPPSVPHRAVSTARWNWHEADTTLD